MNNKGFTLIELVATIALLAIIASISFVSVNAIISSNKKEQCNNLLKSIDGAVKEWVSDNRYNDALESIDLSNFSVNNLNGYLTMPIVDPYSGNDITNNISINISLENYNVKNVVISGITCE